MAGQEAHRAAQAHIHGSREDLSPSPIGSLRLESTIPPGIPMTRVHSSIPPNPKAREYGCKIRSNKI